VKRIQKWLSRILGTNSLIEKKEILSKGVASEDGEALQAYLSMALDPRVTYGITSQSIPQIQHGVGDIQISDLFSLLVRLATRELSGVAAREAMAELLHGSDPNQALWVYRLLDKDLSIGLLQRSINDVLPGLIYTLPIMLAKPEADLPHLRFPAVASLKKNGVRVVAMLGESGLQLITRGGHSIENFVAPAQMIEGWDPAPFHEYVLDGEATVETGWLQDTMTVLRRLNDTDEPLRMTYNPFDCIPREEWGTIGTRPYRKRMKDLAEVCRYLSLCPVRGKMVNSMEEAIEEFSRVKGLGEEGLVLKPLDGPYEPKRSFWWIKMKGFDPVDGRILRILEGKSGKKYAGTLGAIELEDEAGMVYKAAFSGSDEERLDLWTRRESIVGAWAHFKVLAKTRSGSGQNAVFLGLRDDK
jgi:DNA ligase-1